jgi:hypothetical protein
VLRADDEVVGTLVVHGTSQAEAATANQRWTFGRRGRFLGPALIITENDAELDASFRMNWRYQMTVTFGSGESPRLEPTDRQQSSWEWRQPGGAPAVSLYPRHFFFKSGAQVRIWEVNRLDLPLLVVLGWYLVIRFGGDPGA